MVVDISEEIKAINKLQTFEEERHLCSNEMDIAQNLGFRCLKGCICLDVV